ncbi:MAG TPA: alpha/beta hydrolase [Opitutaceae bacterium]
MIAALLFLAAVTPTAAPAPSDFPSPAASTPAAGISAAALPDSQRAAAPEIPKVGPDASAGMTLADLEIDNYRLWIGAAPGAIGTGRDDVPALTRFQPPSGVANGTAVIVVPGGAYLHLSRNLEGREVADWFASRGVTAFVLTYRLAPRYLYPAPLQDAERAVRWVRQYAAQFHLRADRIGMIGFSAGGHLAAMMGTTGGSGKSDAADPIDRLSSRPDFLILGYPWLNAMSPDRKHFLHSYETEQHFAPDKAQAWEQAYDPITRVTHHTPPTFIYITEDDSTVPADASVDFYRALIEAQVPAELHIFRHGKHGTGLGKGNLELDQWPGLLDSWMRGAGFLPPGN